MNMSERSFDQRGFRNVLGRFATGVALVTASAKGMAPIALTINSFASVSLDPALVLWSLDRTSECGEVFAKANGFGLHFLTNAQQDMSTRFSRKDQHGLADMAFRNGQGGAPLLADCPTWLDCRIHARHDGGDHIIFVGEVLDIGDGAGDELPLIYYRGKYRDLVQQG